MLKHWIAAAVALTFASAVHAGEAESYGGVAADAVSTGLALTVPGAVETNPLGWATVPIRMAVLQHAKRLPREEGQPLMDSVSATSWGAAANNLLVLAGAGPAAPVVGIVVGMAVWKSGETERQFWRMCALHRSRDAATKCEFKPLQMADAQRWIAQAAQQGGTSVAAAHGAEPGPLKVAFTLSSVAPELP